MLTTRRATLKPILESAEGVHLTAYLVNRGNAIELKTQLRETIKQGHEWLKPVMSLEERIKFLEPLDSLLKDTRIFKQMKGNIGIFRNQEAFRILNIPVEVEQICQVATSFHVKPLLKWIQSDQEFLLLGLTKDSAQLYHGSQDSLKLIDSILFPDFFSRTPGLGGYSALKEERKQGAKKEQTFSWLNDWISQLTTVTKPKLFLAGERSHTEALLRHLKYVNLVKTPLSHTWNQEDLGELCQSIRKILKSESKNLLEKTLLEFRFAEEGHRARKNIFQIARAVVRGRVRKLIVTDELNIFGKIDRKSGGLAIHPFDLDHEDDDILDDLAQMVLSQGGEVVVASRNEIPKGRPILAILDDEDLDLLKSDGVQQYQPAQERIG